MFSRGLAVCSVLVMASIAQGGAVVQLVVTSGACPENASQFPINGEVAVDVNLVQNAGGADQLLRMVELDLQLSAGSNITLPVTHDRGTPGTTDDVRFWRFDSLQQCVNTPSFCSFNHYIDDDLPAGTVDTRANVLSAAYYGLSANNTEQLLLMGNGTPLPIGKLIVTMPGSAGVAVLNVMNAADVDTLNRRSRLDYGFDTHITWKAGTAAPNDLTGGTMNFTVVSTCGGGCPGVTLASAIPPFTAVGSTTIPTNGTLWRTLRHVIRLDFNEAAGCTLAAPTAGQIQIRELLAAGAFGSDLSASFTFTLEAGNVLRIREPSATATVLTDNKWFAISNPGGPGGWPNVAPFEVHFPVNVGDFDGNRFTTATDVSGVNSAPGGAQLDQSRADINGDGFKTATDVSLTNSNQGPPPVKPSGH